MELSELTAYAEEKFHIREQRKWADFPGFSVLTDPNTGKWVALLMRQWDFDTGTELQWCDIKCGRRSLFETPASYLSPPFRMKGPKWVGVRFDRTTEPEVVFRLFDRAMADGEQRGFTLVLEDVAAKGAEVYRDTALPLFGALRESADPEIPEEIRKMLRLYEYGDGSFGQKCKNFYRQGKYMEDYEDDAPWDGAYKHYFPTYHDLNVKQLRGYFAWRARVRKGDCRPIATSLAYLYLYELLSGIGTDSPEDALQKMREFEIGYLDSGVGDPGMGKNLRRWMLEFAITHDISPEIARGYADPALLERDGALTALKYPKAHTDEELVSALFAFAEKKAASSPVLTKDAARGTRLFARVWRHLSENYRQEGKHIFTACFGERRAFPWHPLSNAIYWDDREKTDVLYELNGCRRYRCRGGLWQEEKYENLYFDLDRFRGLLHETDRKLRVWLKTGHYLREKPGERWASPYIDAVIAAEKQAELEAARPVVRIDLSCLEQIRRDARLTSESLLTEEEMDGPKNERREGPPASEGAEAPGPGDKPPVAMPALPDALHIQFLTALLRGEPAEELIKARRLMPAVVADGINEALFEQVGDNVLTCDGDRIAIVEDYREDIIRIMGGNDR